MAPAQNILRPYTTIRLPFLSQQIATPPAEVEALLVSLILDNQIYGRIDQINQILVIEDKVCWGEGGMRAEWPVEREPCRQEAEEGMKVGLGSRAVEA